MKEDGKRRMCCIYLFNCHSILVFSFISFSLISRSSSFILFLLSFLFISCKFSFFLLFVYPYFSLHFSSFFLHYFYSPSSCFLLSLSLTLSPCPLPSPLSSFPHSYLYPSCRPVSPISCSLILFHCFYPYCFISPFPPFPFLPL